MPKKTNLSEWHFGDLIEADRMNAINTSVDEIWEVVDANTDNIDKILEIIDEPPIYVKPTISLSLSVKHLEHNTNTSIIITPTYNNNDGGNVREFILQCGDDNFTFDSVRSYIYTTNIAHGKSITFSAKVLYDEGEVKNTLLGNPYPTDKILAGETLASVTINSYARTYYGAVSKNILQTDDIKQLSSVLNTSKSGNYTIDLKNQRLVIAYPKSFGYLTSIKDANGFEYLSSYNIKEIMFNEVEYIYYIMNDAVTITNFKQTFS